MAIDFDVREPKNQKLIAAFMIVVVVLFGYYHFMLKPKQAELKARTAEIAALENTLRSMRSSMEERKRLDADKVMLEAKLAELETYLPSRENVSVLLDQFSSVENDTKVYVVGFKASETRDESGKPYQANQYKVTIEAGYHQFVEFMAGIMALPRILSFSELKIGMNPGASGREVAYEGLEDQPRSLSIECSITSYVFRDIDAQDTGTKGKKK